MEKISIASYAFHGLVREGRMNVFGYLETVKCRYGAHADIWSGMIESLDEDYLRKIKTELDARDLVLANLCVDGPHLWEDDPDVREANYRKALEWIRAAEILGAQTMRLDAGGRGHESFTDEMMDLIVSRFREYSQLAHDRGFKFGPENHWGPEVVPETMVAIAQAVNHPGFGVLLHFRGDAGDQLMAPYVMHTHVDWRTSEGDLMGAMQMLCDAGYRGFWGVEHHTGQNEYTEVAIQVAKVRDVLDRWKLSGCDCCCCK